MSSSFILHKITSLSHSYFNLVQSCVCSSHLARDVTSSSLHIVTAALKLCHLFTKLTLVLFSIFRHIMHTLNHPQSIFTLSNAPKHVYIPCITHTHRMLHFHSSCCQSATSHSYMLSTITTQCSTAVTISSSPSERSLQASLITGTAGK